MEMQKQTPKRAKGITTPKAVTESMKADPSKVCFLSTDGKRWFWNEDTAIKHFGNEYTKIK